MFDIYHYNLSTNKKDSEQYKTHVIIPLELRVSPTNLKYLSIDGSDNTTRIDFIRKKLNDRYLNKCCQHGIILGIYQISVGPFICNRTSFDGSVSSTVWCECDTFNPTVGSVLVGCEVTSEYLNEKEKSKNCRYDWNAKIICRNVPPSAKRVNAIVHVSKPKLNSDSFVIIGSTFCTIDIPFDMRYVICNVTDGPTKFVIRPLMSKAGPSFDNTYGYDDTKYAIIDKLGSKLQGGSKDKNKTDKIVYAWNSVVRLMINTYELIDPAKSYIYALKKIGVNAVKKFKNELDVEPISRAFYKAYEFVKMFDLIIPEKSNILTLADAPGGMTQCLALMYPTCKVITTSLKLSEDVSYKGLIYDPELNKIKNVEIDYLKTGNGDLTNSDNIRYLNKTYGQTFSLITSDGAFDFSGYEQSKEIVHLQLLISEIICGVTLQKIGGSFCAKFYNRFLHTTNKVIYWLSTIYEKVYIYKMRAMRIYNSEMMLLCIGFKGITNETRKDLIDAMDDLKPQATGYSEFVENFIDIEVPEAYRTAVSDFNLRMIDIRLFCDMYGYEMCNHYGSMLEDFYEEQKNKIDKYISK
jgi:23S rRNA U2552 (ribose-2'-O)-methylase RlmE/FtsJ